MIRNDFGAAIYDARTRLGLNMSEFVNKLDNIITVSYISRIESYDIIPSPSLVVKFAVCLKLDESELLELAKKCKIESSTLKITQNYDIFNNAMIK